MTLRPGTCATPWFCACDSPSVIQTGHWARRGLRRHPAAIATRGDIRRKAPSIAWWKIVCSPVWRDTRWSSDAVVSEIRLSETRCSTRCFRGCAWGETAKRQDAFEMNHNHIMTDNHLYRLAGLIRLTVGVLVLQSGQNRIAHNHIHDLYYTRDFRGWNWGCQETPCRDNIVEFNHMTRRRTEHAERHGRRPYAGHPERDRHPQQLDPRCQFLYLRRLGRTPDEGSTGMVWRTTSFIAPRAPVFTRHGRENIVRNNIFAFG